MDLTLQNIKFLPKGSHLTQVNDANPMALPKSCELRQLAHYIDDSLVLIDQEIWNVLDDLNKAAIILHEAIYRYERGPNTLDSRHARKLVGYLFSNSNLEPILDGVPNNARFCYAFKIHPDGTHTYEYKFYYLPQENLNSVILQFEFIGGLPLYSKTIATVPAFWKTNDFDRHSTLVTSKIKDVVPVTIVNYGYEFHDQKPHIYFENQLGRFETQCIEN